MADPTNNASGSGDGSGSGSGSGDGSVSGTGSATGTSGGPSATPPAPGERRLAHPPSDRYRVAGDDVSPESDPAASRGRGVAFGAVAGIAGAAAIAILGGALTVTAGLVVVAAAAGWAVGIGSRAGGGTRWLGGDRVRTSVALALIAVALGQIGLWAFARSEGGVLAPLDLLWQVYGGLVPLEFGAAAITAWITAR